MLSNIGVALIVFGICHASPRSFTKYTPEQEIDSDGDFNVAYMTQYVDHFNFKSHGAHTYKQKYLISGKLIVITRIFKFMFKNQYESGFLFYNVQNQF